MGMHNNMSQLVQMNFLSIFLRSSSAILIPGMMEKDIHLQKEKQDFLEYFVILHYNWWSKYMITAYTHTVYI